MGVVDFLFMGESKKPLNSFKFRGFIWPGRDSKKLSRVLILHEKFPSYGDGYQQEYQQNILTDQIRSHTPSQSNFSAENREYTNRNTNNGAVGSI